MADHTCRSCGTDVSAGTTSCPECGTVDPVTRQAARDAVPESEPGPGTADAGTPPANLPASEAGPTSAAGDPSAADPLAAEATPTTAPAQEPSDAGTRVKNAGKAIGCFAIALLVLAIAVAVGLLDFLF